MPDYRQIFALEALPLNPRTRFAPSPTGYLHLGHLLHLVYLFDIAQALQARIVLRIEDHDRQRCRFEYEASILADLQWLGYAASPLWASSAVSRQSDHRERYDSMLAKLKQQGRLYACDCSREAIRARQVAGHYDGHCRQRGLSFVPGQTSWRLNLPEVAGGDFSVFDRKGNYTYLFCSGIDDLEEEIDLVVRGMDLIEKTAVQQAFRQLLGAKKDLVYYHHPLMFDAQGQKLSKRFLADSLRSLAGPSGDKAALFAQLLLT